MLGTQDVPQVCPCILPHLGNIFHQNKQQPVVHLQPIHSRTFTSKFSLHHAYECHLLFKTSPQPCLYFNYVSLRYVNEKTVFVNLLDICIDLSGFCNSLPVLVSQPLNIHMILWRGEQTRFAGNRVCVASEAESSVRCWMMDPNVKCKWEKLVKVCI